MPNPLQPHRLRRVPLAGAIVALLAAATTADLAHAAGSPARAPAVDAAAVAAARSPGLLLLRAGIFDPLQSSLALPDFALAAGADTRYGIVQFHAGGAARSAALAGLGVDVVSYLPHNAYLVRWNGARGAVDALPSVRWTGPFLPGYKFDPALWAASATELQLIGFPGTSADTFSGALAKLVPGLVRVSHLEDPVQPRVHVRVPVGKLRDALRHAAMQPEVMWIERYAPPQLLNADSYGPIQSNSASNLAVTTDTPIWNQGITGSGQIVAVADSGLDRNQCSFVQLDKGSGVLRAFTDAEDTLPPAAASVFVDRKVVGYWVQPGATAYDNSVACVQIGGIPNPNSYHGTHVVGSVLGDHGAPSSPTNPAYDTADGMAPNAQVLFQDIGNDQTGCLSGIGVLEDMYEQAQRGGARIHSNSWGAATAGVYTGLDADADRGSYRHEDMLVLFAAGNDGADATTIGSPGNAKNVLTVGANAHGNNAAIASFSSRGPTADGRTKPDLTAPGSAIVSARGDNINEGIALDQVEALQCLTQSLSGTSMATPTTAGAAAMARQYFVDGFYPGGVDVAENSYAPTGALMKAVLTNGTSTPNVLPSQTFGWGRVWLDNNLYFPGDTRALRHFDVPNVAGLAEGDEHSWTIVVPGGGGPEHELRATLAWSDPPGSPAAAQALVNNLDLEVVAPGGATTYKGNQFTNDESTAGGSADTLNNLETVRIENADAGTWTLRVRASAVPGNGMEGSLRQGYALAVSQAACATAVAQAPANPVATDLGLAGVKVDFGAVTGAAGYQIYRSEGTCATAAPSGFRLVGAGAGTTYTDTKVTGGLDYAYRIRGVDGCGEGPISQCASVSSTAACELLPSFDVESVVVSNDPQPGNTCGTQLTWAEGASRCVLGPGVRYNVYRSTQFDFVPGPANLLASGIVGTSHHDADVDPLVTYFYVVRAEDTTSDSDGPANAGNESAGLRRVHGVASGATSNGTYADSVEPAFMLLETPWSISNDAAADGSFSYRNAADGSVTYLGDTCASITTPPIALGAGSSALSYAARYVFEDQWDGVVVEISTDGGTTWADLPPSPAYPSLFAQTGTPPINACGYAATQGAFSGTTNGAFVDYGSSLASYAGQTVHLRWRFSSDPATEEAGFFLDKLRITNAAVPGTCTRAAPDQLPTAVADAATVPEDSPPTPVAVLGNDTDPDGGPKSIASVTQPANGTVAITGGGTGLTYAPDPQFCAAAPDTFSYTLNGGSTATVSVTVTCVDDAPVAVADQKSVAEDAPATAIAVLDNDTDIDGGPKAVASVVQPPNGTVAITGGGAALSYTPDANFCAAAADSFSYALNGGSSATVSVTVTCVDDAPNAVADTATVAQDAGPTAIPVLANDTDIDGGPKSIAAVTQPANGTVAITGGGSGLSFAPAAGFCSATPQTFSYTLNGGSTASVSVTVPCTDDVVFANGFESP